MPEQKRSSTATKPAWMPAGESWSSSTVATEAGLTRHRPGAELNSGICQIRNQAEAADNIGRQKSDVKLDDLTGPGSCAFGRASGPADHNNYEEKRFRWFNRAGSLLALAADANGRTRPPLLRGRRLRPGDTIGLISPATPVFDPDLLQKAERTIRYFGWKVKWGRSVGKKAGCISAARSPTGSRDLRR
jgi:hypothetical protein